MTYKQASTIAKEKFSKYDVNDLQDIIRTMDADLSIDEKVISLGLDVLEVAMGNDREFTKFINTL